MDVQTRLDMAMFLITSALVLPAVAVLSYQFLRGGLTATESNRSLAIREPEPDYWSDAAAFERAGAMAVAAQPEETCRTPKERDER